MPESKHRLDGTNIQLGKELWLIHSSLAVYRVIGLNAGAILHAGGFLGFAQNQSLSAVALGLGKVFEREQPGGYELCSVGGVIDWPRLHRSRTMPPRRRLSGGMR
jgi:hypothetical protein